MASIRARIAALQVDYSSDPSSEDESEGSRGTKRAQPLELVDSAQVGRAHKRHKAEQVVKEEEEAAIVDPSDSPNSQEATQAHIDDVRQSNGRLKTLLNVANPPQEDAYVTTQPLQLSAWDKRIINGHLTVTPKFTPEEKKHPCRPLSEAPNFNYEKFEREFVPSDKRAKLLYPESVEKRTTHRDLVTECELLRMYFEETKRTGFVRRERGQGFFSALAEDIEYELHEVEDELKCFDSSNVGPLARWEYDHLDNDGGTTFLQQEFEIVRDPFKGCEEARAKYEGVCSRTLEQWEKLYNLHDARSDPGVFVGCEEARRKYAHLLAISLEDWLKQHMNADETLKEFLARQLSSGDWLDFGNCEEGEKKYGYLNSSTLAQWEEVFLDEDGGTSYMRDRLLNEWKIFRGCPEAETKYRDLIPTKLEMWEHKWIPDGRLKSWIEKRGYDNAELKTEMDLKARHGYLLSPSLEQWERAYLDDDDSGTTWVKEQLLIGKDVFQGCSEAKAKYQYLIPTELERWERKWLDADGGTTKIEEALLRGHDMFLYTFPEAWEKYKHLYPTRLQRWERRNITKNDSGNEILRDDAKWKEPRELFSRCPEAQPKYGHLLPTRLERWEHSHLLHVRPFQVSRSYKGSSVDEFFKGFPEAKAKYGHNVKGQMFV